MPFQQLKNITWILSKTYFIFFYFTFYSLKIRLWSTIPLGVHKNETTAVVVYQLSRRIWAHNSSKHCRKKDLTTKFLNFYVDIISKILIFWLFYVFIELIVNFCIDWHATWYDFKFIEKQYNQFLIKVKNVSF